MEQMYRIAGLTVRMDSFGKTVRQAEAYRILPTENADITIRSDGKALKEITPSLSEEDCEYLATGSSFARELLFFDGMILHAAAVICDKKAYLFSAPCGTGKSTHSRLWQKQFGVQILNDDKPALRQENGIWYAYDTPWNGKDGIAENARVPLGGIAFLEQAAQNRIEPLSGADAIYAVLSQTSRPKDAEYRVRLLALIDRLLTAIPVWKLQCNTDPEAAVLARRVMTKEG